MTHSIIKNSLVRDGYLPNYPYHLISDEEMFNAFIGEGGRFFDMYPLIETSLEEEYNNLISSIRYHIARYSHDKNNGYILPDWVYSFMLASTISIHSDVRDIHDLIYPLGVDNIDDIFDEAAQLACYKESVEWVKKLKDVEIVYVKEGTETKAISTRPPTLFGEPHVVKSVRLKQSELQL